MSFFARTDIGLVREQNQDSFATSESESDFAWAVVCDGMGGALGGNIASEIATTIISDRIVVGFVNEMSEQSVKNLLHSAFEAANLEIYEKGKEEENLHGMGTTAVAMVSVGNKVYFSHVGDSRAYILNEQGITQVTHDHSIVQLLIDSGELTEEGAKTHPQRNIITRALGVDAFINPEFNGELIEEDDTVLICTDGLSNVVSEEEIFEMYLKDSADEFVDDLVDTALQKGGSDNITVVCYKNDSAGGV